MLGSSPLGTIVFPTPDNSRYTWVRVSPWKNRLVAPKAMRDRRDGSFASRGEPRIVPGYASLAGLCLRPDEGSREACLPNVAPTKSSDRLRLLARCYLGDLRSLEANSSHQTLLAEDESIDIRP
jgi:hypothetical protein